MSPANRKASPKILWRLATHLRRLRKARGHTQERLGKLCGFSKTYISNIERATVNIILSNLEALAVGLGCAEEDLLRRVATETSGKRKPLTMYTVLPSPDGNLG